GLVLQTQGAKRSGNAQRVRAPSGHAHPRDRHEHRRSRQGASAMMRLILAIVSFVVGLFRRAGAPKLEIAAPVDQPETRSASTELEPAIEFDTVGPSEGSELAAVTKPTVADIVRVDRGQFVGGWWNQARQFPIHKGRLGGNITAKCTVVHTTDMAPGTMAPLLKRWRDLAGEGAGAHFLIGKMAAGIGDAIPSGGIVQLAPITRNGNHAGGRPAHGWFKGKDGQLVHPNLVAIGIEIDNAGALTMRQGMWVHKDSGKVIPTADVHVDARGRGWEKITDYQWGA